MYTKKKILTIGATVLLIVTFSPFAGGDNPETELGAIQRSIDEKGLQWTAGETSVSQLSVEEKRNLCGALDSEEPKEHIEQRVLDDAPLTYDWRNVDGVNWMTSIKNQGSCSSCVAFGHIAAFEALINIELGDHTVDSDLSEARLFYCGCSACCGIGWQPQNAANYLQNNGVPDEGCYPYDDVNMPCVGCSDLEERSYQIDGWTWIANNVEAIKAALLISPVPTVMDVYNDFYSYTGGIYEHASGGFLGRHQVTIVGYDENEDCWICKNSWGDNWGEPNPYDGSSHGGWFRIRYGNSIIGTDTTRLYGVSGWRILCGTLFDGNDGTLTGGRPYHVNCNLDIPSSQTLTLNPGVHIYLSGNTLAAAGVLDAWAVSDVPILLVSSVEHNGLKLYRELRLQNGGYYKSG